MFVSCLHHFAEGHVTYVSNGDGTVTIYPVPSHLKQSAEFNPTGVYDAIYPRDQYHAETVTLPDGDPDMIRVRS